MKTVTQKAAKILVQLEEQAKHNFNIAHRHMNDCPNLPSWFTDKPAEYYFGGLSATYGAIELILHIEDAYNGYSYVWPKTADDMVVPNDPEAEPLRNYLWKTKDK